MADAAEPLATLLSSCGERLKRARAAMLPIEAYFDRMNTVLLEAGEELRRAAVLDAVCRAALDSGDIEAMLRARDAMTRAVKP